MPTDLGGRVAIVTGGAREEGLTAAEALLQAGARVAIWDDDAGRLERARDELSAEGLEPLCLRVDVADAAAVRAAHGRVAAAWGAVDVVVCGAILKRSFMLGEGDPAGRCEDPGEAFWRLDPARLRREVEVNLVGTLTCCQVAAEAMTARGSGSLITWSTSPHTIRSPDHVPYGPAAAAIEAFSLGAAPGLLARGVRLNVVQSGGPVSRRKRRDADRLPYDVAAGVICYLAGDASAGRTGTVWVARDFVAPPA